MEQPINDSADVSSATADHEHRNGAGTMDAVDATKSTNQQSGQMQADERDVSQVKRLLRLAAEAKVFCDGDRGYATIPVAGHSETWPLSSKPFAAWLRKLYFVETAGAPQQQALRDAVSVLESRAAFEGDRSKVWLRVGQCGDAINIDLTDDGWRVVQITADGWSIVAKPSTPFRRSRGMRSLPTPQRGGSIEQLREFVNVHGDEFVLLVGWLLAALSPQGPYPIAVLCGEQGTAKSSTSRVMRDLIDPNEALLREEPRDTRDLVISANNAWVLAFDNMSTVSAALSNALCRLSTGGGFSTRALYENDEEVLFNAQRPVILNGIEALATRSDLLDRSLIFHLPLIEESRRRPEGEFRAAFEAARPFIIGALLDGVVGALKQRTSTKLENLPRLADFALWVTAAEESLGWAAGTFIKAYTANRSEANELALDSSPIVHYLIRMMDHFTLRKWSGTSTELLKALCDIGLDRTGKREYTPKTLSDKLRLLAPNLRATGWELTWRKSGGRRLVSVERCDSSTASSAAPWHSTDSFFRSVDDLPEPLFDPSAAARDLYKQLSKSPNFDPDDFDPDDPHGLFPELRKKPRKPRR